MKMRPSPIKIEVSPEDVEWCDRSRNYGLVTVDLFGTSHHLELIRVYFRGRECKRLEAFDESQQSKLEAITQACSDDHFLTFEIPGDSRMANNYVAFMTPFDD